jgi:hypothetical protein
MEDQGALQGQDILLVASAKWATHTGKTTSLGNDHASQMPSLRLHCARIMRSPILSMSNSHFILAGDEKQPQHAPGFTC